MRASLYCRSAPRTENRAHDSEQQSLIARIDREKTEWTGFEQVRNTQRDADKGQASEQARDESKLPRARRPNKHGQTRGCDQVEHEHATVGLGYVSRTCLGFGDARGA